VPAVDTCRITLAGSPCPHHREAPGRPDGREHTTDPVEEENIVVVRVRSPQANACAERFVGPPADSAWTARGRSVHAPGRTARHRLRAGDGSFHQRDQRFDESSLMGWEAAVCPKRTKRFHEVNPTVC
jgi:hypothetical protein